MYLSKSTSNYLSYSKMYFYSKK